jgi:acetyl esterase/lipase
MFKSKTISVRSPPLKNEKIIYFLHGGGYNFQSAHPDDAPAIVPKELLKHAASISRAFAVEYRLTTGFPLRPSNPFPTALIDALAGYLYLVREGFAEKDIVVMGDSAGGNLALALIKYLIDNREQQPLLPKPPGSLVLLSPWSDVGESLLVEVDPQSSRAKYRNYDMLGLEFLRVCAESFVGDGLRDSQEAFTNAYISPASPHVLGLTGPSERSISFKGYPRTWIDVGGLEIFSDQVQRLRDAMIEDLGQEMVHYHEVDGAFHD